MSIRQLADEADIIAAYAHEIAAAELLLTVLGDKPATRSLLDSDDFPDLVLAIRHAHTAGMDIAKELPRIIQARPFAAMTAKHLAKAVRTDVQTRSLNGRPELVAGIIADATIGLSDRK